jgi:hypothetical protein
MDNVLKKTIIWLGKPHFTQTWTAPVSFSWYKSVPYPSHRVKGYRGIHFWIKNKKVDVPYRLDEEGRYIFLINDHLLYNILTTKSRIKSKDTFNSFQKKYRAFVEKGPPNGVYNSKDIIFENKKKRHTKYVINGKDLPLFLKHYPSYVINFEVLNLFLKDMHKWHHNYRCPMELEASIRWRLGLPRK